jgi:hypothetical protein
LIRVRITGSAYNWGDSDETAKAPWTFFEHTGMLDITRPERESGGFDAGRLGPSIVLKSICSVKAMPPG